MNTEAQTAQADDDSSNRMEIVIAILLGIAAIVTAWCSFQASQLGDVVQKSFSEGIREADAASQAYNTAISNDIRDQTLFLEFAKAAQTGDEETALYVLETLMSPELAAAVDWWSSQPDDSGFDSPFVEENPEWSNALYEEGAALDESSQTFFDAAEQADNDADAFDLLTVILTLALFFFGVAGLSRQRKVMIGLSTVGTIIIVFSIIRCIAMGDPAGVF
ncbi:MAG: hypothetical protein RL547_1931 [Actinomycetota bacterium]|jgi:hypothetical protein